MIVKTFAHPAKGQISVALYSITEDVFPNWESLPEFTRQMLDMALERFPTMKHITVVGTDFDNNIAILPHLKPGDDLFEEQCKGSLALLKITIPSGWYAPGQSANSRRAGMGRDRWDLPDLDEIAAMMGSYGFGGPRSRSKNTRDTDLWKSLAKSLVDLQGVSASCPVCGGMDASCPVQPHITAEKRRRKLYQVMAPEDREWVTREIARQLRQMEANVESQNVALVKTFEDMLKATPGYRWAKAWDDIWHFPFWLIERVLTTIIEIIIYVVIILAWLISYPFIFLYFAFRGADDVYGLDSWLEPKEVGATFHEWVLDVWDSYWLYALDYEEEDYETTEPWTAERLGHLHRRWWNAFVYGVTFKWLKKAEEPEVKDKAE